MSLYYLMNKDAKIALLECINDSIYIKEIYVRELPAIVNNIDNFINSRSTIIGRSNLLEMAKIAGMNTRDAFLELSKAISITDTIWINSIKNPTNWEKVNPYSNRISRIIADIAIDGVQLYKNQNLASPSPQYRIDGSADKCVKRINGTEGIYLYKTNGELWHEVMAVRPYSEYFASKFMNILDKNISKVDYFIIESLTYSGYIKPYTYCKLFTSEKNGLVEYSDSIYNNVDLLDLVKHLNNRQNTKNVELIRDMLMIDSLILNPDRHKGNYGFIIDNDRLVIKQFTPIYDNDCSLGSIISLQGKSFEEAFNELKNNHLPKTELGDYDDQALIVMNKAWYRTLKSSPKINLTRGSLQGISQNRVDFINYLLNRRIKEVVNLVEQKYHLS